MGRTRGSSLPDWLFGDTISVWESLAFQPWFTATAANVGYAYWSHDIGGHMPGAVEPELYSLDSVRRLQSDLADPHGEKPEAERRIWAYPEPYAELINSLWSGAIPAAVHLHRSKKHLRYGLRFCARSITTGPRRHQAYDAQNEYMFGDSILADPVTGASDEGFATCEDPRFGCLTEIGSNGTAVRAFTVLSALERSFSISQIPLYVKAGSIIPMQPGMSHTGERPVNPLILTVFPLKEGQESKYRLYEDVGNTPGYQYGESVWTPIRAASSADGTVLTVTVAPVEGHYKGMRTERACELRLPESWPPSSVSVNGESLAYSKKEGAPGWRFEGDTLTTVITTHSFRVTDVLTVTVRIKSEMARHRAMLDGFPARRSPFSVRHTTF